MKRRIKLNKKIDLWLLKKKMLVKESTFSRYNEIVDIYIRPYLGNIYTHKFNNELLTKYIYNLVNKTNLNNKTIKDITILLKQIFKYSDVNVDVFYPKYKKNDVKILEEKEQKKLEKYLCNNLNYINMGILLSLYTGLRIGEICALKWKNIDLEKGIVFVENTILRIKDLEGNNKTKVIITTPKSHNSIRYIPIPNEILILLIKISENITNDDNYFITNSLKYMEPRTFYYHYKKIMKRLELQNYNFHALRHTFATRCISLGFDSKTLSEILGHSDIRITLSLYVHPNNQIKVNNMEKLHLY